MQTRMIVLFITILLTIGCAEPLSQRAQPQQSPTPIITETTVPFAFSSEYFAEVDKESEPRLTAQEAGTDIPIGVAPAHDCYNLKDKRPLPALDKGPRYFHPAQSFICLIPLTDHTVSDFSSAYPQVSGAASRLKALLRNRPKHLRPQDDLPDLPLNNASPSIIGKVQYLDFRWGSGIIFLTQYSQEMQPNPVNNEELTYNFQGLTKNGKYYIAARFAVTHPTLPEGIDFTRHIERDKKERYLRDAEARLNRLPGPSFRPSLEVLQAIMSSIKVER